MMKMKKITQLTRRTATNRFGPARAFADAEKNLAAAGLAFDIVDCDCDFCVPDLEPLAA